MKKEASIVSAPPGSDPQQVSPSKGDWYALAHAALASLAQAVQNQQPLSFKEILLVAKGIATSLGESDLLLSKALVPSGPSLIGNMINVAVISVKVGMGLGYHPEQLGKLSLAGLVHDLGMFRLPKDLLENEDRWSKEHLALLHRHPLVSAEMVQPLAQGFPELPSILAQEHERINGKGYPKGLQGNQIHEFAQIIGIADLLDAVLRTRPYRPQLLPYQAIRQILVREKDAFAGHIIKALVQQCSLYPHGTLVRLNTGEAGVVLQSNPRFPLRPIVQVTQSNSPGEGDQPKLVDLSRNPLVHVVEVIPSEDMGER